VSSRRERLYGDAPEQVVAYGPLADFLISLSVRHSQRERRQLDRLIQTMGVCKVVEPFLSEGRAFHGGAG
jgi:hypothetical protein